PGFRNSTASYTVRLLNPKVIHDLRLAEHGLKVLERPMQNFLPLPDGTAFCSGPTSADTLADVRRRSPADAERLPAFHAMLDRAVAHLRAQFLKTPPTDLRRFRDLWSMLDFGREVRRLPLETQRELHELFTRSAGDLLDAWFEDAPLKALFGFDAIVGAYQSPYSAGSAYVLLHHALGEVNGKSGVWGHAVGGMGAITQAMAKEAARLGVHIETEAPVQQVLFEANRASERPPPLRVTGVQLEDGRRVHADIIAANVNPKLLFLRLLPAEAVP